MQRLSIFLTFALFLQDAKSLPINTFGIGSNCPSTNAVGTTGYIASPNFPQNYSNQMNCLTEITVEKGNLVQLIFYSFETELGADIVTLYDGSGSSMKQIVKLSGFDAMHTVYQTRESNVMTVKFTSDFDNTFNGYFGFYQGILPSQNQPVLKDCERRSTYTAPFGVIVSPMWPDKYPNQEFCIYSIKVPSNYRHISIRLNYFNTEPNADIVKIYQGSITLTHLKKQLSGKYESGYKIQVDGNEANVVFLSDLDNRFPGFSVTYVAGF